MSDERKSNSGNPPEPRRSWLSRLSTRLRGGAAVETIERRTQRADNRSETDDGATPESDRQGARDSNQTSRTRRVGAERKETSGIDDFDAEETTGVIELNLAEARRKLDEACKKE